MAEVVCAVTEQRHARVRARRAQRHDVIAEGLAQPRHVGVGHPPVADRVDHLAAGIVQRDRRAPRHLEDARLGAARRAVARAAPRTREVDHDGDAHAVERDREASGLGGHLQGLDEALLEGLAVGHPVLADEVPDALEAGAREGEATELVGGAALS